MQGKVSWFVPSKADWKAMLWGGLYALVVNAVLGIVSTSLPYRSMIFGAGDSEFWGEPIRFLSRVLSDPPIWFMYGVRSDAGFLISYFGIPGLLSSVLYGMLGGLMLYWSLLRWAERGPLAGRDGWRVGAGIGALMAIAFTVQTALALLAHGEGVLGWLASVGPYGALFFGPVFGMLLAAVVGAIRGTHLVATLQTNSEAAVHRGTEKIAIQLGILGLLVVAAFAMYFIPAAVRQLASVPPIPATFMIPGDFGVLSQEPCPAPCFQGITPGITSAQEAFQILWRIGPCKPAYLGPDAPPSAIGCGSGGGKILVDFSREYKETKSVVDTIMLQTPTRVTVGDFIDEYGPPDAVGSMFDGGMQLRKTLIFDGIQAAVSLSLQPSGFPGSQLPQMDTITPDTAVYSVTYYGTDRWPFSEQTGRQPWKGYGTYP